MKIKDFQKKPQILYQQKKNHGIGVHMDHAYISGIGLLVILVDSFSGWPEVVHDRKTERIKQILQVIFSKNEVLKILVSDNAPEFFYVGLSTWLRKIKCTPHKTSSYHPQLSGEDGQESKNGLKSIWTLKRYHRNLFTKTLDEL